MAEESFVSNRSLFSGFRPATEWRNGCHYPARLCNLGLFCFCHVESAGGAERHIASFENSHIHSKVQKRFIFYLFPATSLLDPCHFFIPFILHYSHIQLVVSFEFKKFFVLCGNDVIKTILRNVDVGNVIFPPVQEMRQDHPVDGLMADDHNIIRAPV